MITFALFIIFTILLTVTAISKLIKLFNIEIDSDDAAVIIMGTIMFLIISALFMLLSISMTTIMAFSMISIVPILYYLILTTIVFIDDFSVVTLRK